MISLQNVDMDADINAFNIDLSSVEFFDATTEQQLNDFKDAVNISYDQYITEVTFVWGTIHEVECLVGSDQGIVTNWPKTKL